MRGSLPRFRSVSRCRRISERRRAVLGRERLHEAIKQIVVNDNLIRRVAESFAPIDDCGSKTSIHGLALVRRSYKFTVTRHN